MMPQAEAIYHLQQIELQMLRHRKRLDEILTELADNAELVAAQGGVDAAREALKPLRSRARSLDDEIQANAQKTKSSEDRLYSGAVKNPKELQDLQHEIASLKERASKLETDMLENMLAVDEAESVLAEAETNLQNARQRAEAEHGDLLREQAEIEAELVQLEADREKAVTNVTPENRQLYDRMKPRKGGRPAAAMVGRTCSACGVEQTMAIESAVKRHDSLVYCENCGRILAVPHN
ncbi:MAG: zinc ribbon domain-containing protein [Phototrophicaceae bacterium]